MSGSKDEDGFGFVSVDESIAELNLQPPLPRRGWLGRTVVAAAIVVLLLVWELASRTVLADRYVLSAPTAIAAEMWTDRELLLVNGLATARTAVLGFLVGQLIAIALAFILSFSVGAELVVTKLALVVYSLPTLAIAPILGTMFGLDGTRVAVVALVVFFPTLLATVAGLRSVGGDAVLMVRSLGGSKLTIMRKVSFRTVLPHVFSGLKLGVPGAMLGAIASEWLGANAGLGIFMVNALAYLQPTRVWGTCVVCVLATIVAYGAIALLDRLVNDWTAAEQGAGR